MEKHKTEGYKRVEVEAALSGWILRVKGRPAEIFVRWESLIIRLKELLTNGGEG